MSGWLMVVYALAVARLTGAVTADVITRPAREAILRRLDGTRPWHTTATYLTSCQWCVSIYVAAVVVPLAWWWGDRLWLLLPALVLAASQVTGMLSDLGRTPDEA